MYPMMDNNVNNTFTFKPNVQPKPKAYTTVQITREKIQRKGCCLDLIWHIISRMMLFIIFLTLILLGGYILLKPQFNNSTLMDLVDDKVEATLHTVGLIMKDMHQKIQSLQEDQAHLENLIKQFNDSLLAVKSASEYNITELGYKMEELDEKIQLQDQELKDLEEKGQNTQESLQEFANITRENITETLKQQLFLQESIQQMNESVISLAHATHTNITVQHNSTSKLTERMEQAEKEVEKYSASAEHIKRIDHKVAQLVSVGNIPKSPFITVLSIVLYYMC